MFDDGCSESIPFGITHETEGSLPALAAVYRSAVALMFFSCPSCLTVSNDGNGFQIPGVRGSWLRNVQNICPVSQSGSGPGWM